MKPDIIIEIINDRPVITYNPNKYKISIRDYEVYIDEESDANVQIPDNVYLDKGKYYKELNNI